MSQMQLVAAEVARHGRYRLPDGIADDPCQHVASRRRVGPTSRKRSFTLLADQCAWCGRILTAFHPLSWRQYDWVRRYNRRGP